MTPSVAPICHQKWISWVGDGSENPQDIAQANSKGVKLKNGPIHTESQFPFYKTQKIFSFYNKKGFVFITLQPQNICFCTLHTSRNSRCFKFFYERLDLMRKNVWFTFYCFFCYFPLSPFSKVFIDMNP